MIHHLLIREESKVPLQNKIKVKMKMQIIINNKAVNRVPNDFIDQIIGVIKYFFIFLL